MTTTQTGHVLDNPIWYALNSAQAHFAIGTERAKCYPEEMSLSVGLADHSEAALGDLARTVGSRKTVVLLEANPPDELSGWVIQRTAKLEQMVCQQRITQVQSPLDIIALKTSDVPEMLELIELTHLGPFTARSIELGRFIGIHQQGQLVAMAGERFHLSGYCEISPVCTHPDWQGKGYARILTGWLVNGIWARGETPFLQVDPDNGAAYHLYESLNFRKRCAMTALIIGHV
ncbi:MAG: GNAT family N-acetyltransferase [Anaerolineae bacterium]|nr:GNAT family N-acetyltransferase [Anaerolineae bacterium]